MSLINVANGDFSASLDYLLPVSNGAEYFNFFRGGAANLTRNLVKNKLPLSVSGSPVIHAGYATFTASTNFVQTQIDDLDEFTLMAVGRTDAQVKRSFLLSTYEGDTLDIQGSSLFIDSTKNAIGLTVTNNAGTKVTVAASVNSPIETQFVFVATRFDNATIKINDVTAGLSASSAVTYPRQLNDNTYRVGSGYLGTDTGLADMAFAGIYNRAIDDAELAAIYARVKATVALDSIII